jgi:hypothetical protein
MVIYPTPSVANPFPISTIPFSNPPYAARAYAYVSAAQYDALIAAVNIKKLYRAAPYTAVDPSTVIYPQSDLAAYPSEDAVIAGVTVDIKAIIPH